MNEVYKDEIKDFFKKTVIWCISVIGLNILG